MVLTVPISAIIISKVQAGNMTKTAMIMAVFLILLIAVMVLYKNIFGRISPRNYAGGKGYRTRSTALYIM